MEISATVTDEAKVSEVLLLYRHRGPDHTETYIPVKMEDKGQGLFSAMIPTQEDQVIEYYIQARDSGGNTTFKGDPALPLLVKVISPPPPINIEPPLVEPIFIKEEVGVSAPEKPRPHFLCWKNWCKKWWVWTIISAAAGGALYSELDDPAIPVIE